MGFALLGEHYYRQRHVPRAAVRGPHGGDGAAQAAHIGGCVRRRHQLDITLAVVGDVNTLHTLSPDGFKGGIAYGVYVAVRLVNSAFTLSDDATQTITISVASFRRRDTLRVVCSLFRAIADRSRRGTWRTTATRSPAVRCRVCSAWTASRGRITRRRVLSIVFHNGVTDSVVRRMHGGRAFTPRMRSPLEWLPSTASQPVAQTQG